MSNQKEAYQSQLSMELQELRITKQKEINGLENEVSRQKLANESLTEKHQKKLTWLQTIHEGELLQRDTLLNEVDFLLGKVRKQKEDINDYVKLDMFFFWRIEEMPNPHIIFRFRVFNKSIFDVTLENEIGGYIEFRREILQGGKLFYGEPEKIKSSGHNWFSFKYRLKSEELAFFSNYEEVLENDFDISNLILTVKSSDKSPKFTSKQIRIERHSKVWNYKEYEKAIEPFSHI